MLVSTVIPAYNAEAFVREAVDSALGQTYGCQEVILVDDGSVDSTSSILASYDNAIRVVTQSNQGLSAARNAGVKAARGELIAFLDADDRWLPDKLERQIAAIVSTPNAGLVHSSTVVIEASDGAERVFGKSPELFQGNCRTLLLQRCSICVSSVMVRRSILEAVGGFDENIQRPTTQDYDLWIRLSEHCPFAFVAEPSVLYLVHDTNASKGKVAMLEDEVYVFEKALRSCHEREIDDREAIQKKLADLYFDLGYYLYDRGRNQHAKAWLRKAWRAMPWDPYRAFLAASTLLPATAVSWARKAKRSAAGIS